ncbi:MAG: 3-deoxy-D-manno-octulosonic acid transferase [Candidatus Omnitrophota bacterium]|nr:3-deoxy-D-manno-octulosonic acid transferase [Candidatus Omnitrophota bacterium]
MWLLYDLLLLVLFLLYLPKALWRRRLPHRGWTMRLGRYPAKIQQRLAGRRALWVHAVSVGEMLAVRPLLQQLTQRYPQDPLVVSTITPGGFQLASEQMTAATAVIYFPLDLHTCVRRALDCVRPKILLLMESELWPLAIHLTKAQGIPIAVINGRLSPQAFARYRLVKRWLRGTLARVDLLLMQSQTDADRILQLGASAQKVRVVGSLKWDASLEGQPSPEILQATAQRLGLNGRQSLVVAGSTHRGEERFVLEAFASLKRADPHVRLIVAPRHLERLAEVEALIRRAGMTPQRLSADPAGSPWEVGIVDTFGQLSTYYGLATAVFIGGSLIPHGGQNPLEPASLGKPVIFGPSMHNFADIAQQLLDRHAARQLRGGSELAPALHDMLKDRAAAEAMGRRAQDVVEASRGTTQRTLEALAPFLQ